MKKISAFSLFLLIFPYSIDTSHYAIYWETRFDDEAVWFLYTPYSVLPYFYISETSRMPSITWWIARRKLFNIMRLTNFYKQQFVACYQKQITFSSFFMQKYTRFHLRESRQISSATKKQTTSPKYICTKYA